MAEGPGNKRKWAIGCTAVAVIVAGIAAYFAYSLHRLLHVHIPDAYAGWTTANLIIGYMQSHDGAWPGSWDDLLSVADDESTMVLWQIAELPGLIAVDWSADPRELAGLPCDGEHPPFLVVTRANGRPLRAWYEEPNTLIWRSLQSAEAQDDSLSDRPASVPAGGN